MSWLRVFMYVFKFALTAVPTLLCDQRGNNEKLVLSLDPGVLHTVHEIQPK